MIENIIVQDDRGRGFVNGLRSASEQMRASVSKFNEFCDGWCRYNKMEILNVYLILTKQVKKYKVKIDSSEDKYRIYKSALDRFINKFKKQV